MRGKSSSVSYTEGFPRGTWDSKMEAAWPLPPGKRREQGPRTSTEQAQRWEKSVFFQLSGTFGRLFAYQSLGRIYFRRFGCLR